MPLAVTKAWMPCVTLGAAPKKPSTKPAAPSQPVGPSHHQAHSPPNPTNKSVSIRRLIVAATVEAEESATLPWRNPHAANSAPPSAAPTPPHRRGAEDVK